MVKRKKNDFGSEELQLEIFDANQTRKQQLSKDPATRERFSAFKNTKIDQ